jgi:hypothetical protein
VKSGHGSADKRSGHYSMNAAPVRSLAMALVSGLLWSLAGPVLHAQTLADIARKEEERRKTVQQPAKVYTNKDLSPVPASSAPPPSAAAAGGADSKGSSDAKSTGDAKDATPAPPKAEGEDKGEKKDQAYWSGRLKALQQQLDRDQSFADALQVKINALTTDFVNRDDPAQRSRIEADRTKSLAELARLKKAVIDDNKAIADLQEEARRASVPPGWLR